MLLRNLLFTVGASSALIPNRGNSIRVVRHFATNMPAHLEEAKRMVDSGAATLLDVREPEEWLNGHFAKAINVPYYSQLAEGAVPAELFSKPLVIYCKAGVRSQMAAQMLTEQGASTVCIYESFNELCHLEFDDIEY